MPKTSGTGLTGSDEVMFSATLSFLFLAVRSTITDAPQHRRATSAVTKPMNPQGVRYVAINHFWHEAGVIRRLHCRSFWCLMLTIIG